MNTDGGDLSIPNTGDHGRGATSLQPPLATSARRRPHRGVRRHLPADVHVGKPLLLNPILNVDFNHPQITPGLRVLNRWRRFSRPIHGGRCHPSRPEHDHRSIVRRHLRPSPGSLDQPRGDRDAAADTSPMPETWISGRNWPELGGGIGTWPPVSPRMLCPLSPASPHPRFTFPVCRSRLLQKSGRDGRGGLICPKLLRPPRSMVQPVRSHLLDRPQIQRPRHLHEQRYGDRGLTSATIAIVDSTRPFRLPPVRLSPP